MWKGQEYNQGPRVLYETEQVGCWGTVNFTECTDHRLSVVKGGAVLFLNKRGGLL